jgi:hypothetical protein
MTDTADIAALRNKFGTKLPTADDAKEKFIELLNGPHASSWFLSPYVVALLDRLEAERQQADEWKERAENASAGWLKVIDERDALAQKSRNYEQVAYGLAEEIAALKFRLANPVVLSDCSFEAVSHMAHWYSEEQCEAWVAGVEHAKKQIVAAGCIVQTSAPDKEDDHQPSAPAVLHDVLTAVSIGGGRTELIDALTAIKPKFGAPGSRDVDVRAAHLAIDKAIEKLSNL